MICTLLLALSPALAQDKFSFVVVGDTQTDGSHDSINWDVFPAIVESANALSPALMLVAGDLVNGAGSVSATAEQWEDFLAAASAFDGELYMVPGNHDVYGGAGTFAAWRQTFPWLPTDDSPPGEEGVTYYIDYGNTRFVMITSDGETFGYGVSAAGLSWLDRTLKDGTEAEHLFVVTHHPVTFSDENNHGGTGGDFWQTLVAYGVDGLFTGHWHRYQPSQPGAGGATWETIIGTGGGWQGYSPIRPYQQVHGFLLVEVDGPVATASFYVDEDGDGAYDDVADSYTMAWGDETPRGLRARYTFDDGAVSDSASGALGKAIHGTLAGDAAAVAGGARGQALDLDGAADYAEAGAIGDYVLAINGDLTLSTWVQVDAVVPDDDYGSVLLCYGTNDYYTEDEETNYSYFLSLRDDGALVAFWEHDSGSNVYLASTATSALLDGGWHHAALVREGAQVRFYVDGAQLGDAVGFDEPPTGGGRGMLYLGADTPYWSGYYDLDGRLDEVCIYDLALDDGLIAELAALGDCAAILEEDAGTTDGGTSGSTDGGSTDGGASGDAGGSTDGGSTDAQDSASPDDVLNEEEPKGCGCGGVSPRGGLVGLVMLVMGVIRRRA